MDQYTYTAAELSAMISSLERQIDAAAERVTTRSIFGSYEAPGFVDSKVFRRLSDQIADLKAELRRRGAG